MSAVLPGTFLLAGAHALDQMLARNVGIADVIRTLSAYEQCYSGYAYGELRVTYQRDDIAVVVAPQRRALVTVLYRSGDDWRSENGRPSGAVLSDLERRRIVRLVERVTRSLPAAA